MSNRAYLAASNKDTLYPSFAEKKYDPSKQLIASDVECLPLLWLAMFRKDDLRTTEFQVNGQTVVAFAPICTREKAIAQLNAAVPYLHSIYPELGTLRDYAAMMQQALEVAGFKFVTIELEEIAALFPEEHRFKDILTLCLSGFDAPHAVAFECDSVVREITGMTVEFEGMTQEEIEELGFDGPETVQVPEESQKFTLEGFKVDSHAGLLERVTDLRPGVRLPSVLMYLDDIAHTDDEAWNFTRVLGAGIHGSMGYGREVPWEKEDADFGFEFRMDDDNE